MEEFAWAAPLLFIEVTDRITVQYDCDLWKDWSLEYFEKELPIHLIKEFKTDLIRIAYTPTKGEELEGVNETAIMILETINIK